MIMIHAIRACGQAFLSTCSSVNYSGSYGVAETETSMLRAEVDANGYGIVIGCNGQVRYVQLKTSRTGAKTRSVPVNVGLQDRPGGCVIWIKFDKSDITLGPFLWFGGKPGNELPSLGNYVGRHTRRSGEKGSNDRPAIRMLNRREFTEIESISELVLALFGRSNGSKAKQT